MDDEEEEKALEEENLQLDVFRVDVFEVDVLENYYDVNNDEDDQSFLNSEGSNPGHGYEAENTGHGQGRVLEKITKNMNAYYGLWIDEDDDCVIEFLHQPYKMNEVPKGGDDGTTKIKDKLWDNNKDEEQDDCHLVLAFS